MRRSIVVVAMMIYIGQAFAQPAPDTLWTRTYGAGIANAIRQMDDGGFVIVGATDPSNAAMIVRTNSLGDSIWTRRVQGSVGLVSADACALSSDGGSVVVGRDWAASGSPENFYAAMVNSTGDTLWTQSWGTPDWRNGLVAVEQTLDGNFIAGGHRSQTYTGWTYSYPRLIKFTEQGTTLWSREYLWPFMFVRDVKQTIDGGYLVAGELPGYYGPSSSFMLKTDANGDTLWTRQIPGTVGTGSISRVVVTGNGNYDLAIAGIYGVSHIVQTDSLGGVLWTSAAISGYVTDFKQTAEGGLVIVSHTSVPDIVITKTNSLGEILWTRQISNGGDPDHRNGIEAQSVVQARDGGFMLAGYANQWQGTEQFLLIKTGPDRAFQVLHPNGGENLNVFRTDTIKWVGYGFNGGVRIQLDRNYPDSVWETLVDNTPNDGSEPVFISDPLSQHCRIKVSTVSDTLFDVSDSDFAIVSSQGYLALARSTAPGPAVLNWNAGTVDCRDGTQEIFLFKNFGSETLRVIQLVEPVSGEFWGNFYCPASFALAPGQMSACSLNLWFGPTHDGVHWDTLLIQTDAMNGTSGYVRIPLTGTQVTTPENPQIVIQADGHDVFLSWNDVTQSIYGCNIIPTWYLIYHSPTASGPYVFLGRTWGNQYTHDGAVQFAGSMYYMVTTYLGPAFPLESVRPGDTMEEVAKKIGNRK